ncbi:MAG: APC family permease [Phycisphaerales bacterium]|nr:APC family permease [Phycisphaerales bacterium]
MQPTTAQPESLRRQLTLLGLWLLVVNGMIGAGIFGIPADAQRLAGAFSPWLFALGAILIAPIMLCFAQLSSAFTGTGGPVLYAQTAFGPFVGFQIGWAFYIARLTASAANINLLVATIGFFWQEPMGPAVRVGLLLFTCAVLVWLNVAGARTAMRSLGFLTVVKLLPLLVLAAIGLTALDRALFASFSSTPKPADLGAAILLVIYAYVGFESGLVPAGESRRPQRDMPRALVLALVGVGAVYFLIQAAAQRIVPDLAASPRPIVEAGEALLGRAGAVVVVVAIIASVGGNLLGSVFSAPRVTYCLALERQLPPCFALVHPRRQTPWVSIVVYGGAIFGLAATGSFARLAVLSVFTRLLIYIVCIAAMPRVSASAREDSGVFRLPGGHAIPALALLVCLALLTQVSRNSVLATAVLLAVGTALFWIASVRRRSTPPPPSATLSEGPGGAIRGVEPR